ncbi:MAG: HAD family phosphatase [Lachnospiraceae bacterium]|nr:HAD family phosphatase [Lachnospiraceae bacterium]
MKELYPFAIFDMDGTLVDSMPYWRRTGAEYLIQKGLVPEEGLWEKLALLSTEESAVYLREHYGLTDSVEEIVAANNHIMYEHYRLDIPAKPGVPEYLDMLEQAGVIMSVCSATSPDLVDMTLTRLGLRHHFRYLTSCDEVNAGKDRPDVFLLALKKLSASPEEAVMYEDADFGIRTAKALGMHVAGVYDPTCQTPPEEISLVCDTYIRDYRQIDLTPQRRK